MPVLNRTCVINYKIPGSDKIIEKGTEVFIPAYALQMDEQYYDEPRKFKPERFTEESSAGKNLVNKPYIPFGDGPRNCIGMNHNSIDKFVLLIN